MNFQQLKVIRAVAQHNLNISKTANTLEASQSGLSKHIKDLEDELGVKLLHRKGKRILGLTEPAKELLSIAERLLTDVKNIKNLTKNISHANEGTLTIATTHAQARYVLPTIIQTFTQQFPKVKLRLLQVTPQEVSERVLFGQADLAIATDFIDEKDSLTLLPFYEWKHCIVTPAQHPLLDQNDITLDNLARYPIIAYHDGVSARSQINQIFKVAEITPNIVMSALDADVIKTYIEAGLGISILSEKAFDATEDLNLRSIPTNLFGNYQVKIAFRKDYLLRDFSYSFISLCAKDIDIEALKQRIINF